jgi:hypothetical protein
MKNLRVLSPLLTLLFVGSMALAQEAGPAVPDAPQPQNAPATQPQENSVADTRESGEGSLISQVRHYPRFPRRPMRPPRGQAYPPAFPPPPAFSPVGALIGFGAGALLGVSKAGDNAGNARAGLVLIGGGLGALFGGVIGGIVGGPHSFRHHGRYGPSWPGEDEEGSLGSKDAHHEKPTSAKAAEPRETPVAQDVASPSSTRPASAQETQ